MRYDNQKPGLEEQIRALLDAANTIKTRPHGLKTVDPDEGLLLTGDDGSVILWNHDEAAQYDARIKDAQKSLDEGTATLAQVQADLNAAQGRIEDTSTLLGSVVPRLESAERDLQASTQALGALQGTVGDVQGAAARAQAMAEDALLVGFGRDVLPPRGPEDTSAWSPLTWDPAAPGDVQGQTVGALAATRGAISAPFPVIPGDYSWSVSARASAPDTRYGLQMWWYDAAGADLSRPYLVANQVVPADAWESLGGTVTAPEGAASAVLQVYALHSNGARPDGAVQWFRGLSLRRLVPGALVVNGSITGDHIDATTVAGRIGQFLQVEAQSGTFTDSLTGRNARLLGETMAEALNITGKLRGRDAIFTGTVDLAQLNVTGDMSAAIVRAMKLEARQGIFTEGLTANEATLLGTTVAERLNAGVVASRIITSGLLQTDDAANRGVKIDTQGIRAWSDTGAQTVQINGKSNYITGTFATAEKEQRVEIKSGGSTAAADFFGSGNTVDHLGVWHQADQGNATASRIISQNGMTRIRDNPGMVMWPFRGDFGFVGRWSRNTDTLKMFSVVNYGGLPGGGWVDLTFRYTTPFPTTYSELIPVVSVESRSGAECTINTRTNNADSISFRVVNKSTNPTDVLYLRGVTFNFNTVAYTTTY